MLAASITGFPARDVGVDPGTEFLRRGRQPLSMICAASFSRMVGEVIASITAARTAAMTVGGVLAGAIGPFQASASTSTPASFSVGMPSSSARREASPGL